MRHLAWLERAASRCVAALATALIAALLAAPAAAAAPADFSWSPDPPVVREQAIFTALQDPAISSYQWDLDGDGRYGDATGPETTRTFQRVRVYEVGLLTVDVDGTLNERRKSVRVVDSAPPPPPPADAPPRASFVLFPAGALAGEPITFVSTSTDPDSPIASSSLAWDLDGDGAFDDAEGPSATTAYAVPGTYTVSLRITTNATDVATLVLEVGAPGAPVVVTGQRVLSFLSPFPVVRIAGRVTRRGARIRRLSVDAPPGTRVKVRCSGRRCPFKRVRKTISSRVVAGRGLPASRLLRVRRIEGRMLRPGVTLRLFVTRSNSVGKYTRFRIRRSKPPRRVDRCLVPGSAKPVACPAR